VLVVCVGCVGGESVWGLVCVGWLWVVVVG